jgi:hypothetical protein
MHKSATKCNKILGKWCKNKHGASKIIDTLETYQRQPSSYCYGPIVRARVLTHRFGGKHGDEEDLRWRFPSPAGCREELLDPPDLGSMTAADRDVFMEN